MFHAFSEVGNCSFHPLQCDLWICRQDSAAAMKCKQYFSRGYLKVALIHIIAWQIEREFAGRLIEQTTWGRNRECNGMHEYSGRLSGLDPSNVDTL